MKNVLVTATTYENFELVFMRDVRYKKIKNICFIPIYSRIHLKMTIARYNSIGVYKFDGYVEFQKNEIIVNEFKKLNLKTFDL